MRISKKVAFVFTIAMALPFAAMADGAKPAGSIGQQMKDISLRADGVLVGHVVNSQGEPVAAANVIVRHGKHTVAKVTSDRSGGFIVRKLRGGVHQVVAGQGSQVVRFWTAKAAPPASKASLTIVSDKSVVRGQCGDSGCTGGCGTDGCGEGCGGGILGGSGGGFLGMGAGGVAGTVAAAAIIGGVLAATLDDDDDPPADDMMPASA